MRILALTSLYPTPCSPHSCAHNRQQIAALSRQADVEVIAPVAWTKEWFPGRSRQQRLMPTIRRTQQGFVSVRHPQYLYPPAMLRRWHGQCYRWSVRRTFIQSVREFQPDVIYAPWAYPDGWTAVRLGHELGLPVVVKVMGSDLHSLSQFPGRRPGTIETLRLADRIIAVSRQLAGTAVELGADFQKVRVIYNGVDRTLFTPGSQSQARQRLGLDSHPRRLLFVGNLVPVKQVEVLIDACRELIPNAVPFCCHIIGDGPLRERLADRVTRDGLKDVVRFEGQRSHTELPDWYRAADVVVLPSRSEGVPNVLLEAQACGVPIVASRVGGIPEIVSGEPHRLVPAGDSAVLAEAIADVLANAKSPMRHGQYLMSWDDSATALKAVFQDVLNSKQSAADNTLHSMSQLEVHAS